MPASQLRGCTSDKEWGRRSNPRRIWLSACSFFPGPARVESRGRGSRAIGVDPLGYCHTLSPRGSPELLWGDCRCPGFQRCPRASRSPPPPLGRGATLTLLPSHNATPFREALAYPKRRPPATAWASEPLHLQPRGCGCGSCGPS